MSDLPDPAEAPSPGSFKEAEVGEGVASGPPLEERWWEAFGDDTLSRLIAQAEENSPTLEQAVLNVERALAEAGLEASILWPQVEFLNSATRARQSGTTATAVSPGVTRDNLFLAFDLAWELDVWGRVRRLRDAARLDAEAARRGYAYALVLLRSQVAERYFALREVDRRIGILDETTNVRRERLELIEARLGSGLGDELAVAQARAEYNDALADLERARSERREEENALAALTGALASEFRVAPDPDYAPPEAAVPQAVASELLRRRADISEALQLVKAAAKRVGAQVASFYPSISLGGNFGYASSSAGLWFEDPSRLWSLGPSLNLPLFQGKERARRLELARIEYGRLFSAYREQILQAVEEVETSLATLRQLDREKEALVAASTAADRAAELALQRYQSGIVNYLEVVDTQRVALSAALRLSEVEMERLERLSRLAAELGGGWEEEAGKGERRD